MAHKIPTNLDLTEADEDALRRMPEGWFSVRAVPYMVRNARYRCDRLEVRGKLKSRVVGEFPDIETQWIKI